MKKLILAILLLIVLTMSVSAYTRLEEYKDRCYPDGSFSFNIENVKSDSVNLSELELYAYHAYQRFGFYPNGTWNKEVIYFNKSDPDAQRATFVSYSREIVETGDYIMAVRYYGCRDPPCKISFDIENCNGYAYNCENFRVLTESCYQHGGKLYARFKGENPKYFKDVDVYKELLFYADSNNRDLWGVDYLPNMVIEAYGDELYQVSFPFMENEVIEKIAINHRNCDSPRLRLDTIECKEEMPEEPEPEEDITEPVSEEPEEAEPEAEEEIEEEAEEKDTEIVEEPEEELEEESEEEADKFEDEGLVELEEPEEKKQGIPMHFVVLILIVIVGVFAIIASYIGGEKKKKPGKKPPSFGFGK